MAPISSTSLSALSLGPKSLVPNMFFSTATSNVMISRRSSISASASNKDSYDGKLVDQSMIFLRLRILDIQMKMKKMMKEEEEMRGVGCWRIMEWERRYWEENYASDICQAVGLLQTLLMETRPCLALAILLLVFFSLWLSMSLSLLHLVGLGEQIFMSINF